MLVFTAVIELSIRLTSDAPYEFAWGLGPGLCFGLIFGAVSGGFSFVQHYGVLALLVNEGAVPWRYRAFLQAMTGRLLLHNNGGSYLFVHRLLRDYLADYS